MASKWWFILDGNSEIKVIISAFISNEIIKISEAITWFDILITQ